MAIKTSINKLRDTQSNLDSIVKSIYSSITSNRAVVADAIRIAKDCIYKYQQAIHDYEKDINYAKKVIDHNQSAVYKLDREIGRLDQIISKLEWDISRTGYPKKPNSTGNTEVDAANRKAWEEECAAIDRKIDSMKEQKEDAIRARDRFRDVKELAEDNISKLQRIIRNIKLDIDTLNVAIRVLNDKIVNLQRAESIFASRASECATSLRKVDARIYDAIARLSNAIEAFKATGIYMNESSVIDISSIEQCNLICRDIKNKLTGAYQSKSALESAITIAQRDLKDNTTGEAAKIIDKINAEYSRVVDALDHINKAVDKAMECLRQYENC